MKWTTWSDDQIAVATPEEQQLYVRYLKLRLWWDDPALWAEQCIDWSKVANGEGGLTEYQIEILQAIPREKRVSVRGPHGLGKTGLAAIVVLWFSLTRDAAGVDWKVLTTASAWRQLTIYLWPEIHKWARLVKWDEMGRTPLHPLRELQQITMKLNRGQASAVASDEPSSMEGGHADHILYLLDEAKAIPTPTIDAIEGAFSGAGEDTIQEAFALMISTPGEPSGRFHEIQSKRAGTEDWWTRHVTLEEAIKAGRISRRWAEQRARQWGEGSSLYQNRVLGEFATQAEDAVIPLSWVEAANRRWQEWHDSGEPTPPFTCVGVDVARSGQDKTIMAPRFTWLISELRETSLEDTMETSGRAIGILNANPGGFAVVDVIGIGAGVVDRLREAGFMVVAFNASAGTTQVDLSGELGFINQRSAAWWTLRELLDPANHTALFADGPGLALPPDDQLIGDLTAPRWRVTSGGKIQVESKDDIRKRLGRSTDHGDGVVQAFALIPERPLNDTVVYEDRVSVSPF